MGQRAASRWAFVVGAEAEPENKPGIEPPGQLNEIANLQGAGQHRGAKADQARRLIYIILITCTR